MYPKRSPDVQNKPYDTATWILDCLSKADRTITPGSKILDYGCGAGDLVYRFRELGFEAYGFDIHKTVQLRSKDDERYFGFSDQRDVRPSDMNIEADKLRIPFEDATFDLIVSTSVLEHVLDHEAVFKETARVLKRGGVAFHVYPDRRSLIEPHMYVPLATRVQNWWWFYLWALLGIRNEFQGDLSASKTADMNTRYSRIGISYPPLRELLHTARRYFGFAALVNRQCQGFKLTLIQPSVAASYILRHGYPFWKSLAMSQRLNLLVLTRAN
jgi:SAM-dependent methyltransferase